MATTLQKTKIHPTIKQHLSRQGVTSDAEIEQFLYPRLKDLPSPFLMKDMEKATKLVLEAIEKKADITVWGDYDVDGITGTALLILFFEKLNLKVQHHIPNRLTEGYGLNSKMISKLSKRSDKTKLLITVDCGISNHEEIAHAQRCGFKVIVTDHHNLPDNPVTADAIINPKQPLCTFPYKELSGVGVAFYLASAIRSSLRDNKHHISYIKKLNMKYFMDLVTLGTIADVVPLTGVNRILAKAGLESLSSLPIDGIVSLFDELGVSLNNLNGETISFNLAPTINAAGRLGEPNTALLALISKGHEARQFSQKLIRLNKKRKKIGESDFEKAIGLCRSAHTDKRKSLVIKGPFHDGLLGIVASRLVERFKVPAFVCCDDGSGDQLKGSARAPDNFNLFDVISSCSRFLIKFGGHEAAAGFSLERIHFEEFENAINNAAILENINKKHNIDNLRDNIVKFPVSEALNSELLANISLLEPLGEGNPKPIFLDDQVRFISRKHFGKNKEHIRGMIRGKFENIPYIGFNVGETFINSSHQDSYTVQYSHMLDVYNNRSSWKIKIEKVWL